MSKILKEIIGWVEAILIAVIISVIVRAFLFETTVVNMSSMEDTLNSGQRLIVNKFGYYFNPPKRGDIVVFVHKEGLLKGMVKYINPFINPQEIDYIKRVIGVSSDEVDIKDGFVYINGIKQNEIYTKGITEEKSVDLPIKIPENKLFVLGDNREASSDSREIGLIDTKKIRGKATFRIWPFEKFGSIYETNAIKKTEEGK